MRLRLTEPARPAWVRQSPNAHWFAVGGVCMGAFMIQLDASIVTLALRDLQVSFDAPLGAVQWVSLAYVLTLAALVTPLGRLSDAVGRKLVYLAGFTVFTLGSAACALAPSLPWLVAFRVAQAVGAAAIATNSVAVVTSSMPAGKLKAGLAVQSSVQALGLAMGPVVGGFLVGSFGWRSVFLVNVPIGVAAVALGTVLLPRTRSLQRQPRFDWAGMGLLACASTALLLGLSGLAGLAMPAAAAAALLVAAAAAACGFWLRERSARYPMVDLRLLRAPGVAPGLLGAHLGYLLLYAPLVLVPQLLIPLGFGEQAVGPMLAALPAGFMVAALAGDKVPLGRGKRTRLLAGVGLAGAALLVLAARPVDPVWVVPSLAVLGVGLGVVIPVANTTVMSGAPATGTGTVSGVLSMVRNVGTALGVAFVTLSLHAAEHDSRNQVPAGGGPLFDQAVAGGRIALAVLLLAVALAVPAALAMARARGRAG